MTGPVAAAPPNDAPPVTDVVVRELVRGLLRRTELFSRLILLDGRYDPASATDLVVDAHPVHVVDCPSVLAARQAWQRHRLADGLLVILTTRDEHDLGVDLCSHAVGHHRLPVHRWQIVLRRFGARDLDPRLRRLRWVADGLLEAEPPQGWPKLPGSVLDHDTALYQLARRRLGLDGDSFDAAELLTLDPGHLAGMDRLRADERAGLEAWLVARAGATAKIVLLLARAGRAPDIMAFGLVASAIWDPEPVDTALARAQGRAQGRAEAFLGAALETAEALAFADVVRGVTRRWIAGLTGPAPDGAEHRHRVETLLHRADRLLAEFGAEELADRGPLLDAGLRGRLRVLAGSIDAALDQRAPGTQAATGPAGRAYPEMERALDRVVGHELASLRAEQVSPARMAVRLLRWLAEPLPEPRTVAEGILGQIRDWGWVDQALAAVWRGEPDSDPALAAGYGRVHEAVRAVRDRLDKTFAGRLAAWAPGWAAPDGLLLIEHVLDEVAVPLARRSAAPPLIIVVDGMSAAVAVQLADQIRARGWTESVRSAGGREASVAAVPSVTATSRTSLLCGRLTAGDAAAERTGFIGFWRRHGRTAVLFHKADLPGGSGQRIATDITTAISRVDGADALVVGVVLNTVDESLDHGREGGRVDWHLDDVRYLPELLAAANNYGRPVLLLSDHGHVLERERGAPSGDDASAARWRPAAAPAGKGEVELTGERVLLGDGRVVTPWREGIRYTARKAGYHGGASLAEMSAPVLTFLISLDEPLPTGWRLLTPERTAPRWWSPSSTTTGAPAGPGSGPASPTAGAVTGGAGAAGSRRTKPREEPSADALFELPSEASTTTAAPSAVRSRTLGQRVVASAGYRAQGRYVRKPPAEQVVAAIIDALADSGDRLSTAALAELAATPVIRVPGLVAVLRSLLNVEGYPVLTLIDGGRTLELDRAMLHSQFNLGPVTS